MDRHIHVETKGMLVDKLAWLCTCLPDNFPSFITDATIASEFDDLEVGIEDIRKKLGPEKYEQCLAMAREARAAYHAGDKDRGEAILMDMQSVVTGIKGTRLRDMDPETRAHVEAGGVFDGNPHKSTNPR